MSNAKQILAMLRSRAEGDDDLFLSIALQIAASEARQGHRSTADQIRSAVEAARTAKKASSVAIPFARPRGDLEGLLEHRKPRYTLKDVVLSEPIRGRLNEFVREQLKRAWLREHSKTPNRRALFVGPPGSGKTMTAEALAGQLSLPLFVIRLEALITRYMGETAAKLRLVFDETAKRRAVYLFDEFDAVGGRRTANNDVAEMRRVLNSFLQYMEEENATDSIIIGATNHPELLDNALVRRFDIALAFEKPTKDQVRQIILAAMRPFKAKRLSWTALFEAAEGLSQAEITRATEDAVKSAILNESDTVTSDQLAKRLLERREMHQTFSSKKDH
ncbi:ATP-binding protein [Methylocystis echinoides]|uniref:AAA family ATPase n=1 Tax=Methylocystis echinoides TaxID=29468 RepID=UPI003435D07D